VTDLTRLFDCSTGEVLKLMRLSRGWSQTELADLVGLRKQSISNLERGSNRANVSTRLRLEAAMNLHAGDLEFLRATRRSPIG
jgi:transcriptional regulator with XRE-family HTH domain